MLDFINKTRKQTFRKIVQDSNTREQSSNFHVVFFYVSLICSYERDYKNEMFDVKRTLSEYLSYTYNCAFPG